MADSDEKRAITVDLPVALKKRIDEARGPFGMTLTAFIERAAESYAERLENTEVP